VVHATQEEEEEEDDDPTNSVKTLKEGG